MRLWISTVLLAATTALSTQTANAALRVFACEPEWASLAQELAGESADIDTATTALQDVHHIQARPSLIAKVRRADLVVCSGAGLEVGWLPLLLRQSGNRGVQPGRPGYFEAAAQVERLEALEQVDRAMGDVHPQGNPHVHLDPHRLALIAHALSERLIEIDPGNAEHYRARHADFARRWQAAPLRGTRVIVHHKAWPYLFDWLDLELAGTLEPKPGVPPSAAHLARLKALLKAEPARFIIRAAYTDERAAEWLSAQLQIPAVELPYTVGGAPEVSDLFSLYEVTLDRLLGAM